MSTHSKVIAQTDTHTNTHTNTQTTKTLPLLHMWEVTTQFRNSTPFKIS